MSNLIKFRGPFNSIVMVVSTKSILIMINKLARGPESGPMLFGRAGTGSYISGFGHRRALDFITFPTTFSFVFGTPRKKTWLSFSNIGPGKLELFAYLVKI